MSGSTDSASQLLEKLKNAWQFTADQPQDVLRGHIDPKNWANHWPVDMVVGAEIQCTTTCAAWSNFASSDSQEVRDLFLLTHDFTCTPFRWNRDDPDNAWLIWPGSLNSVNVPKLWFNAWDPKGYMLRVRYLNPKQPNYQENLKSSPELSSTEDFGFNFDNDVEFMRSIPMQTPTMDSYSNSISVTVGANAGFMGEAAMAGISASVTESSSHSWSVPSVQVLDNMDVAHDEKIFVLHTDEARAHTFQMTVQELVSVKDDKSGSRTPGDSDRVFREFEIQIWPGFDFDGGEGQNGYRITSNDREWIFDASSTPLQHGVRRILRVPAPELPLGA